MILRILPTELKGFILPPKTATFEFDEFGVGLFLAVSLFCPKVIVQDINLRTKEVSAFLSIARANGLKPVTRLKGMTLEGEISSISADFSDNAFLLPIFALIASMYTEASCLSLDRETPDSKKLFIKSADMVKALGADVYILSDRMMIKGNGEKLPGGIIDGVGDPIISACGLLASVISRAEISVCGAESADEKYITFWKCFEQYGGRIYKRQ